MSRQKPANLEATPHALGFLAELNLSPELAEEVAYRAIQIARARGNERILEINMRTAWYQVQLDADRTKDQNGAASIQTPQRKY